MREILFRGKKTGFNEWVYGLIYSEDNTIFVLKEINHKIEWYVDADTIGQYTGLTDKNGKKIFEGDIVAGAASWQGIRKNGVVAFREGSFGLIWYRGEIEQFNPFPCMCNIEYEVIGNIHDNPELLKGGVE